MSDTVLGGDFTIYYSAENGQKRLEWTGSGTGTRTVRELYSALQDLFDDLNQMDDEIPMSAQTPTEFTLINGWFIDDTTTQHLVGGALQTNGWAANEIAQIQYTDTSSFVTGDIGKTVTTSSYSGTILDFNAEGATQYVWIRPDTPGTDDFDLGEAMTVVGGTATPGDVVVSTNLTGEQLWANIFTIGSIAVDTTIYVVQDDVVVTEAKGTTDWWTFGQIDILLKVKDMGVEVDDGVVRVYARKFSALYDNFEVDLTTGGRNPIPLATATDLDNANGFREMILTTASGDFTVGEIIEDDSDATFQGIVTSNTGTAPNITIQYYLIGDPQSDFTGATGTFTGQTSAETATAVAPSDVNGATFSDITITHANADNDLNNGSGSRPYSITVDCAARPLSEVYDYFKYINRRGSTTQVDGIDGEQYIGSTVQVQYNTETGTFTEGLIVTGGTSGATGTIVALHDDGSTGDLILRATRGTFQSAETITDTSTGSATTGTIRTINPKKASPLGTFAGGTMFSAAGVWLTNYAAGQAFQLVDDDGAVQVPPTTVTVQVTNTRVGDRISVFRTEGGEIKKDEYLGTIQSAGAAVLIVGSAISNEAPSSGVVRIVDVTANEEYRLRYSSFTGSTFNLTALTAGTADGASDSTTLIDGSETFVSDGVKVGDSIRNTTESVIAYVVSVDSEVQLTTTAVTDWLGDSYEINTMPVDTTASDTIYVPFLDVYETVGSDGTPGDEFTSIIFSTGISARIRVRNAGVILPFETDGTISSGGLSVASIRTPDTIYQ